MEKQNNEYLGNEGYALMGAAFEVYREIGCGLSEAEAQLRVDGKPKVCPK